MTSPPKQGILFCKGLFLAYSKGDRRNREKFYVDLGGFKGYYIIHYILPASTIRYEWRPVGRICRVN